MSNKTPTTRLSFGEKFWIQFTSNAKIVVLDDPVMLQGYCNRVFLYNYCFQDLFAKKSLLFATKSIPEHFFSLFINSKAAHLLFMGKIVCCYSNNFEQIFIEFLINCKRSHFVVKRSYFVYSLFKYDYY